MVATASWWWGTPPTRSTPYTAGHEGGHHGRRDAARVISKHKERRRLGKGAIRVQQYLVEGAREKLKKVEKLRNVVEKLSDDDFNMISKSLLASRHRLTREARCFPLPRYS